MKRIVNLGKLLLEVRPMVGERLDLVETRIIVDYAYKSFFASDFSIQDKDG